MWSRSFRRVCFVFLFTFLYRSKSTKNSHLYSSTFLFNLSFASHSITKPQTNFSYSPIKHTGLVLIRFWPHSVLRTKSARSYTSAENFLSFVYKLRWDASTRYELLVATVHFSANPFLAVHKLALPITNERQYPQYARMLHLIQFRQDPVRSLYATGTRLSHTWINFELSSYFNSLPGWGVRESLSPHWYARAQPKSAYTLRTRAVSVPPRGNHKTPKRTQKFQTNSAIFAFA